MTRVEAVATAQRTFCVRADDAAAGTARNAAVLRRDELVISVGAAATAAADPRRAVAIRNAIAQAMDSGSLPLRRHRPGPGRVVLVGGGPGDADLLTLRGRRELAAADVVVVDRLAPQGVLDELAAGVLILDVGKAPGRHPVPQHAINQLLVEHAQAGRRVVRLKGGDPFLLGRGGEEVAACRAAGVRSRWSPGSPAPSRCRPPPVSRSPTAAWPSRSPCCPGMTPRRSTIGRPWPKVAAPWWC